MGIISVKKTIGNTDYNYNIITAGAKFSVPTGIQVTVEHNGKNYSAKMHSKTVGIIDGLSAFYKDSGLQIGDEILLTYDGITDVIKIEDDDLIFFGASGCDEKNDKINQGRYQYSTKYEDIMVKLGLLYDNEEELRTHKVLYVTDTHTNKKYRLFESQCDFSVVQIDNDEGLIHIEDCGTVRVYDIKGRKQVRWYRG